jgi:hypothetical protein
MLQLEEMVRRVRAFRKEAHAILGSHEASPSRVVLLEDTYKQLTGLNLLQDDLFRQALRCLESELYRAAHVMAWAAFMDFLEEKLGSDGFKKLKQVRPNWKFATVVELREAQPEYQIIDAAKDVGLCAKSEAKGLHGLLNKRNECAHPSAYFPALNETLVSCPSNKFTKSLNLFQD